ncbi:hypothetical protein HHL16_04060 [Pseudoflavitalea sp. G-6-1-2]|uniref:hypothetical protein n=1 Tax=Pseudoflavitalea sp. G-6-1-2 TaxID=2728841 RepID=UPI00146AF6FD|nr:hypothetical protein [Pseudoflavitalea sp. G-6-1-2]NML20032.1 hypothetical protein [Pseudoflavitalea sp. G-6-1-2]
MKKVILPLFALITLATTAGAQNLAPDQNPNYLVSQQKYMRMADSVNTWHSTTPQETYKAIDFLADKREARAQRKQFRRELRLERARWGYDSYYGNGYYYPTSYYGGWGGYGRYGRHNHWNNYLWGAAAGIGLSSWWW